MEYILTEILKNAFRATVEHNRYNHNHYQGQQPQPQYSNDGSGSGSGAITHTQHNEHHHLPLPPVLITIVPPPRLPGLTKPATLSLRVRDHGGGVSPGNMERIFSYAFTTAGRRCSSSGSGDGRISSGRSGNGDGGGPYAAQQHVGAGGAVAAAGVDFFGEITSKGIETGLGTIAGLGFGLPMSRLYAQ
jgi:26S proteasome regulatory subunit T1